MIEASADFEALRALVQRYARAADARDVEAIRDLFEPDAVIDGVRGRVTVDGFLAGMSGPRPWPAGMHLLGDPLIEMEPGSDGDVARLDTYGVVYGRGGGDDRPDLTVGIRYLDRVVRSPSDRRWRISERVSRTLWTG